VGVFYREKEMFYIKSMNRYQAFGLHIIASIFMALVSSAMVFLVWYQDILSYVSGVTSIFLLLLAVDVVIGPVITLIIFNPAKKELRRDLIIVAILQFSALLYGLHTVFITRPVYIVFNAGQFDVAYANEINVEYLGKANDQKFKVLPLFQPKVVAVKLPDDPEKIGNIIMSSLNGGDDPYLQPEYYVDYEKQKDLILIGLKPLDKLYEYNNEDKQRVQKLIEKYNQQKIKVGYLLLKGKTHNATVVINKKTAEILEMNVLKPLP
jgi:hypothetical protein